MTSSATHELCPCCPHCLDPFSLKGCFLSNFSGLSIPQWGFQTTPSNVAGLSPTLPSHVLILLIVFSGLITSCNHLVYFLSPYASLPSAGPNLAHGCVPRSKQEMCIKYGLDERETPLGRTMSQGDPGPARSSLGGMSNKAMDLRAVGPSQGSSDPFCSQVSRRGPHGLWEAKGSGLAESSSPRLQEEICRIYRGRKNP